MTHSLSKSCSAALTRPKPSSRESKENVAAQPSTHVILDPPLVPPLPIYSYKDLNPAPTRVYVRHEEEANELIGSLSGYVGSPNAVYLRPIYFATDDENNSAVGFDLEWRVFFCKGATARPVATVQLSDRRTILVIQVSAMKGSCHPFSYLVLFLMPSFQGFRRS